MFNLFCSFSANQSLTCCAKRLKEKKILNKFLSTFWYLIKVRMAKPYKLFLPTKYNKFRDKYYEKTWLIQHSSPREHFWKCQNLHYWSPSHKPNLFAEDFYRYSDAIDITQPSPSWSFDFNKNVIPFWHLEQLTVWE